MITDVDRAKYGAEYAALELKEGQALLQEFRDDFSSTGDNRIGRGAAGNVFRLNVSAGCTRGWHEHDVTGLPTPLPKLFYRILLARAYDLRPGSSIWLAQTTVSRQSVVQDIMIPC